MSSLEKIVHYFNIGILPNSLAMLSALGAAYFVVTDLPVELVEANAMAAAFNTAVGIKVYFDYLDVKTSLNEFGWDDRIVRQKSRSWCQRHATKIATKELGHEQAYSDYLNRAGFRWYHIFPHKPSA